MDILSINEDARLDATQVVKAGKLNDNFRQS